MKKSFILSACLMFPFLYNQAQVACVVKAPPSIAGNYAFTWADPASNWGTKDLNVPANSVEDTLMLVDDGTADDSLGCNPLINDLTGKIAVIHRGTCEFGVKAVNAMNAGAVGVIIINKNPGEGPVGMGPGAQGANDTIPTVMVSYEDGNNNLRAQMNLGNPVVVFIGNKTGLFANDLGMYAKDILTPKATANPGGVSQSAAEFSVPLGAWVRNYGTATQTSNVTLKVDITGAATYSATSSPAVSLNGYTGGQPDSIYISVPAYSSSSYNGLYFVKYNIDFGTTDDFPGDNAFDAGFLIDSFAAYAFIDSATNRPAPNDFYKPSGTYTEFVNCIHFRDANASRLNALGIYAAASGGPGGVLIGESLDALLYEWDDVFTGFSDPAFPTGAWTLSQVANGPYSYANDLQDQMVYIPFTAPLNLTDNQRYLFCVRTYNATDVYMGFDTYYNYETEILEPTSLGFDQPVSTVMTEANQYATGFGTDISSAVVARFDLYSGVNELTTGPEVTPYPNPATTMIHVPLKGMHGNAWLKIIDVNGKTVSEQSVRITNAVDVNIEHIAAGQYLFSLTFDDGKKSEFKVLISK